ncbi:MAG: hypothetical protein P8Y13_17000 [Deinococcales bacterium]
MRRDEWARLAAPFPSHALDWCVAQLDREGSTARLEPVVSEAAALVVEHGGYGRSAEEARELYRRLRELLLQKGAVS